MHFQALRRRGPVDRTGDNLAHVDRQSNSTHIADSVPLAAPAKMKAFNRFVVPVKLRWLAFYLLLFGLGVTIATRQAPFYMPDEGAHYLRAYEVSKLHLINMPGNVGVDIPCREYTVVAKKYYPIAFAQTKTVAELAEPSCLVRTLSSAGSYSFVPYIPAALALALVGKLNWTTENKLAAARIANFSVWFSILFFSLMLLEGGRLLMACLMLMPSYFWQLVALSADGATLTSCLGYAFFVIGIAQRKLTVTRGMMKVLVALGAFIGVSKGVYAPVALLAFGLWGNLPGKGWLYKFFVLSCPVIAALGIFVAQAAVSDPRLVYLGNNANPALQLAYVSENPVAFMNLIIKTLSEMDLVSLVAPGYAVPNAGRGFGIMVVSLGAISILMAGTNFGLDKKFRLVAGGVVAILLVSIRLPIYLTYSPVQFDSILGLQGRYYLPVLPLVFVTFAFKVADVNWAELFAELQARIPWVIFMAALGLIIAVVNTGN